MVLLNHVPNALRVIKLAMLLDNSLILGHRILGLVFYASILAQGPDGYFCGQVDKPRRVAFLQLVKIRKEEMLNQDTGHHGLSHDVKIGPGVGNALPYPCTPGLDGQ